MLKIKIDGKPFLLLSTAERETEIKAFSSHEEAYAAMCAELKDACKTTLEEFFEVEEIVPGKHYMSGDGELFADSAWRNNGPNHADFDWQIVFCQQEEEPAQDKLYAVVTTYSFDPSIPVVLFSTYDAACRYLESVFSAELKTATEEHEDGYVTESTISEDHSYAKIVDAHGEDTTEWNVECVFDRRKDG